MKLNYLLLKISITLSLVIALFEPAPVQAQLNFPGVNTDSGFPSRDGNNNSDRLSNPNRPNNPTRPRRPGGLFDGFDFNILQPLIRDRRPKPVEDSRTVFERNFKQADPEAAVQQFEALQVQEYSRQLGLRLVGAVPPTPQISQTLGNLSQQTGRNTALMYVVSLKDELHILLIPPSRQAFVRVPLTTIAANKPGQNLLLSQANPQVIRRVLTKVDAKELQKVATTFRSEVSNPSKTRTTSYLQSGQQLYQWLIAPIESELRANQIDTLLFSMDDGLRSLPIAALHDQQRFLIEKYSVALLPSFGLTNSNHTAVKSLPLLAMGISKSTQGLSPLPAVPIEVNTLTQSVWQGQNQATLDEDSTLANLKAYDWQRRHGIIHLATHAQFKPGEVNNSYIQFWDTRLTLGQLRQLSQELKWHTNPPVEMLVLSACQTAMGNKEAELGFAGSAIQAGVKSTLASLWSVSDEGTLGLMTGFYDRLNTTATKAEALRQTQIAMAQGQIQTQAGQLLLGQRQVPLPPELARKGDINFSHPYYWSGYTVIGNWN